MGPKALSVDSDTSFKTDNFRLRTKHVGQVGSKAKWPFLSFILLILCLLISDLLHFSNSNSLLGSPNADKHSRYNNPHQIFRVQRFLLQQPKALVEFSVPGLMLPIE